MLTHRPRRHTITFSGSPYYKETSKLARFLQPVGLDSDSSDSSQLDKDERGQEIPPETTSWSVGVTCNTNAVMAHQLNHWKMELLDWVDARLIRDGYMKPARLAERNSMTSKQRVELVQKIMDRWVNNGNVHELYRDFKGSLDKARTMNVNARRR